MLLHSLLDNKQKNVGDEKQNGSFESQDKDKRVIFFGVLGSSLSEITLHSY